MVKGLLIDSDATAGLPGSATMNRDVRSIHLVNASRAFRTAYGLFTV